MTNQPPKPGNGVGTALAVVSGVAAVGGILAAAFGSKKRPAQRPMSRKPLGRPPGAGCNCGR